MGALGEDSAVAPVEDEFEFPAHFEAGDRADPGRYLSVGVGAAVALGGVGMAEAGVGGEDKLFDVLKKKRTIF